MNELIPYKPAGQLTTPLAQRTEIVADTLVSIEQAETIMFFHEFPALFKKCVSLHYPLRKEQIIEYEDNIDWIFLSGNKSLDWSADLIRHFEEKWNWELLSCHLDFPWSKDIIMTFKDRWDWSALSENTALPWNEDLLNTFKDLWSHSSLDDNMALPWSSNFIKRYLKLQPEWRSLKCINDAIPWTDALIREFEDFWDWRKLSLCESIPWSTSLLEAYGSRWDTDELMWNSSIPWSIEILDIFDHSIPLGLLAETPGIFWSVEMLDKLWLEYGSALELRNNAFTNIAKHGKFDVIQVLERYSKEFSPVALAENPFFPWTSDSIEKWKDKHIWHNLSRSRSVPWTIDIIEKYYDKWNWVGLSINPSLPWSSHFIERYLDKWHYVAISKNTGIPWNEEILQKYWSNFHIETLKCNKSVKWGKSNIRALGDWNDEYSEISHCNDFGIKCLSPSQINNLLCTLI